MYRHDYSIALFRETEIVGKRCHVTLKSIKNRIQVNRIVIHTSSVKPGIKIPTGFCFCKKMSAKIYARFISKTVRINSHSMCKAVTKIYEFLPGSVMSVAVKPVVSHTARHPEIVLFFKNRNHPGQKLSVTGSIIIVLDHLTKQRRLTAVEQILGGGVRHIAYGINHIGYVFNIIESLLHISVQQKTGICKICIPIKHIPESTGCARYTVRLR